MVTKIDGNTIKIKGKIDSNNAAEFEKQLLSAASENYGDITLDAAELEYISSAGLRVLLKLKKSTKGRVSVINVSSAIYDIFDVTGFNNILDVKKALRKVDVKGCEMIGQGGNGTVYRISADEIIKVYTKKTSVESIENERCLARDAFVAGIPTAIAYDIVKVGDNFGIVFEMVKADVIAKKFTDEKENFDIYARKYAELFKEIHSVDLASKGLPKTKQIYLDYLDKLDNWYDENELERLHWFITNIPDRDTMVHGDYHTNNIMVQGDELLLIDMAEISCGHPIFDLASSYYAHKLNPQRDPGSVMRYLNVTPEIAMKLWSIITRTYFGTDDQTIIDKYNTVIEKFCLLKSALIPAIWVNMPDEYKRGAVIAAKKYLFPQMESLLKELDDMDIYLKGKI